MPQNAHEHALVQRCHGHELTLARSLMTAVPHMPALPTACRPSDLWRRLAHPQSPQQHMHLIPHQVSPLSGTSLHDNQEVRAVVPVSSPTLAPSAGGYPSAAFPRHSSTKGMRPCCDRPFRRVHHGSPRPWTCWRTPPPHQGWAQKEVLRFGLIKAKRRQVQTWF